jgi:hypothetical protein
VRILSDAEFFGIAIKHEPLTRDKRNVQQVPRAFDSLARGAVNKRVRFQQRGPNCRKVVPRTYRRSA